MFDGRNVKCTRLDEGLVEISFDAADGSVNKLDERTLQEFAAALAAVAADGTARGLLVTSAKDVFIVGADITEFSWKFDRPPERIATETRQANQALVMLEDLGIPSVIAINGYALGGGLELALAGAVRVMCDTARVGLPEVQLGLFPGLGGTVRLPRVAGLQTAALWVASGKSFTAADALAAHVVDQVVPAEELRATALQALRDCMAGTRNWRAQQHRKRLPLGVSPAQSHDEVQATIAQLKTRNPQHQPAAQTALRLMTAASACDRDTALDMEARAFGQVAKTQAAAAMIQNFLNDQALKKLNQDRCAGHAKPGAAAVLGAGIMGGGIAYVSACAGVPVRLKDITQSQLDVGIAESTRLLDAHVRARRMVAAQASAVFSAIAPQLDDRGMDQVDVVVEAVVENLAVKRHVLADMESRIRPDTLLATNTSSLRIADIAMGLKRPRNLVGMHFFNPVPAMPLVEVVRGPLTSDEAVGKTVAWAIAMKKTPVVVNDCPGFLVNRILTPYIAAFLGLVAQGEDFERIDQVMTQYGWPMGPAYLEDVVGMDTGLHVMEVIAGGYPQRMHLPAKNALRLLVQRGWLGQKSGQGFYRYERDERDRLVRQPNPDAQSLLACGPPSAQLTDTEIVDRMMLPLILEAVQAYADGTAGSAAELDTAMRLGTGFPAHLGGPLMLVDWLGAAEVLARVAGYTSLGHSHAVAPLLSEMAATGARFYPRPANS